MSDDDFGLVDPPTHPDGTNIPPDDLLEAPAVELDEADMETPPLERIEVTSRQCFACKGAALEITQVAPAPGCEREARGIDRCVFTTGGLTGWELCAGKFLLRLGGRFVWYFGVEHRTGGGWPPDGMAERRGAAD